MAELPHQWIEAMNGDIPDGAIVGGYDDKQETLYVARGYAKDINLAGYLHPKDGCCYVTLEGNVSKCTAYEVLCNTRVRWVEADKDTSRKGCVNWATTESDLFVARAKHRDCLLPGMYHVDNSMCYIPYQGKELAFKKFELLQFCSECSDPPPVNRSAAPVASSQPSAPPPAAPSASAPPPGQSQAPPPPPAASGRRQISDQKTK